MEEARMLKVVYPILLVLCLCCVLSSAVDQYFWQITDVHVDPTYHTTRDSCKDDVTRPGKYGDYDCDAPYELLTSSVTAMKDFGRVPAFIVYTGDSPFHAKNNSQTEIDTEYIIDIQRNITNVLNSTFRDVPIIMTLGNHDYHPIDQLPGDVGDSMYAQMAELWSDWLTPEAMSTFKKGGYYTLLLENMPVLKLRVVVLNTNLYIKENDQTAGDTDPAGQYTWLEGVLQAARTTQEQVHLFGHVPSGVMPGPDKPMWMRDADNTRINAILRDYSDVIMGYYSCHEHLDSFRVVYDNGVPATMVYIAPSVAPMRATVPGYHVPSHNPGVRKITFDEFDGHLRDIEQYYLDLPTANQENKDTWRMLYKFTGQYGVRNISAVAIDELIQRFETYGSPDFHKYYDMSTVGARDMSIEPCSCECKELHICTMKNVDYEAFTYCYENESLTCAAGARQIYLTTIIGLLILFIIMTNWQRVLN